MAKIEKLPLWEESAIQYEPSVEGIKYYNVDIEMYQRLDSSNIISCMNAVTDFVITIMSKEYKETIGAEFTWKRATPVEKFFCCKMYDKLLKFAKSADAPIELKEQAAEKARLLMGLHIDLEQDIIKKVVKDPIASQKVNDDYKKYLKTRYGVNVENNN